MCLGVACVLVTTVRARAQDTADQGIDTHRHSTAAVSLHTWSDELSGWMSEYTFARQGDGDFNVEARMGGDLVVGAEFAAGVRSALHWEGTPPGIAWSQMRGVSESGSVVVHIEVTPTVHFAVYRNTPAGQRTDHGSLRGGPFVARVESPAFSPVVGGEDAYVDAYPIEQAPFLGAHVDTGVLEMQLATPSDPMSFHGTASSRVSLWVQVEVPPLHHLLSPVGLLTLGPLVQLGQPTPTVVLDVRFRQQPVLQIWTLHVVRIQGVLAVGEAGEFRLDTGFVLGPVPSDFRGFDPGENIRVSLPLDYGPTRAEHPMPILALSETEVGSVLVSGDDVSIPVELRNAGDASLHVAATVARDDGDGPSSRAVVPERSQTVLDLTPVSRGWVESGSVLRLESTDPWNPVVDLPVRAQVSGVDPETGIAAPEAAACGCALRRRGAPAGLVVCLATWVGCLRRRRARTRFGVGDALRQRQITRKLSRSIRAPKPSPSRGVGSYACPASRPS
ncbi:MAG: hypothetical protein H6732_16520 [Alphaproteobacteria bacterium]|nr:hypothetical protein [Alphaproteobacteria bacterium]